MAQLPIPLRSNPGVYKVSGSPKLINCYAEPTGDDNKAPFALIPVPGLSVLGSEVGGACRGMLHMVDDDRLYSVNGFYLYEIESDGTKTNKGLVPGTGQVWMARNDAIVPQIVIVAEEQVKVLQAHTNLLLRSETHDNAYWTQSASQITADATTDYQGNSNADKLYEDNTTAEHYHESGSIAIDARSKYVCSFYLKKAELDDCYVRVEFPSGNQVGIIVDLNQGTAASAVGSPSNISVTDEADGWFRVSFAFDTGTATSCTVQVGLLEGDTYGNSSYAGDNSSGIYLGGGQLEYGQAPSAYLVTTSAVVERDIEGRVYFSDFQPKGVVPIGGYFIFWREDGRVYASELLSTDVTATNFATAEASPDGLTFCFPLGKQLYLVGPSTTEIWSITGGSGFPLTPLGSATMEVGSEAPKTVQAFDSGFAFVDNDNNVSVVRGFRREVISSLEVSRLIEAEADKSNLLALTWRRGKNEFYTLHGTGWTREYNAATGFWHDRLTGLDEQWIAGYHARAFGVDVFGDRVNGNHYQGESSLFTEAGETLIWGFDTMLTHAFPNGLSFERMDLDMETGDGISATQAGKVMVSWSDDQGRTNKGAQTRSLGVKGEYNLPIRFHGLGSCLEKGRMFRVRIADAVVRALTMIDVMAEPVDR